MLFFILVFLICSVLFISTSLKAISLQIIEHEPQILVENYRGGTKSTVDDIILKRLKISKASRVLSQESVENIILNSLKLTLPLLG